MRDDVMRDDIMRDDVMSDDVMRDDVMRDDVMSDDIMKDDVMTDGVMMDDITTSIRPVSGWKSLAGSSVVILHCIAEPFVYISCCDIPISGSDLPSHTLICALTRSTL